MDFFKTGFLGTRGDLMSDALILALGVIVPALAAAVWFAYRGKLLWHRRLMLGVYTTLVAYVVLYEGNLLAMGGLEYLRAKVRVPEVPYFFITALHVAIGVAALVMGAAVIRRGRAAWEGHVASPGGALAAAHARMGWWEVAALCVSAATGVGLYWLTFVV